MANKKASAQHAPHQLKRLGIEALRGSEKSFELAFETGKHITILYGENGTGKTTVCDAMEFIGKGRVGSLDGKGLGATQSYWAAKGRKPADIKVTLETSKGQWQATLVKRDVAVSPEAGMPQVEVLRRRQLLELIEAKPANRYEVISPFVDVTAIEEAEAKLRRIIADDKARMDIAVARITETDTLIRKLWADAGNPGKDPLTWARKQAGSIQGNIDKIISSLESLAKAWSNADAQRARMEEAVQQANVADAALQRANTDVQEQQAQFAHESPALIGILQEAQRYLKGETALSNCPLCGSNTAIDDLATRVADRLKTLNAFSQSVDVHKRAASQQQQRHEQATKERERFVSAVQAFAQKLQGTPLPAEITLPRALQKTLDALTNDVTDEAKARELHTQAKTFVEDVQSVINQMREQKGQQASLVQAIKQNDDSAAEQRVLEANLPRFEQALKIMERERRAYVDGVLRQIATRVGELYECIHPGEGLSKIGLQLDPKKRASLEIEAAGEPPGAYFSESHLDTLGLCIYLAIAELKGPANTILVLDDVIASIDEPHVDRVIEMLYDLSSRFQHCIITTHYKPWREKYRWGWLQNNECQFVELSRQKGRMACTRTAPRIDTLRAALAASSPDPQVVCSVSGVWLEAMLDFLTRQYECSVPRRRGGLTLGDLLPNVGGSLRKELRVERLVKLPDGNKVYQEKSFKPILDELQKIMQLRNVYGCHFNELSYDLLDSDALKFGELVLEMADWLVCPERGWPGGTKSGNYYSTTGETRRLYPRAKPA